MAFGLQKRTFLLPFLFISLCGILFCNIFCESNQKNKVAEDSLVYRNHSDSAYYVGMDQCKQCHYNIYETFIQTGMGQSFNTASRKKSISKISSHEVITDRFKNFSYQPFFKNDSLYILEFRIKNKDTIYKRLEKVDFIIGSGQHTNSNIMNVNGYLYQMPLTYYKQKEQWDFPPGFENGNNSRFSRTIELECMSCHNAYPKLQEGSVNKYISIPMGIDCERCHGPGSIHVQEKSAGKLIDTSEFIDYSIVNPKKLPYNLQVDLCQRCHLQGNTILREGKSFFDFKPGMKLSDYMDIYLPRYNGADEQFIMASHADRLKQSKCFIESNKKGIHINHKKYKNEKLPESMASLTCITCHNPHISVKSTKDDQFNNACKSCHQNTTKNNISICTEKLQTRKINGDNCWKCHLPSSGTIDIPHVSVHDHRIQIPVRSKKQEQIKKFIGIAAINNPKPKAESKAEAYLNYFEKFNGEKESLDSAWHYLQQSDQKNSGLHLKNTIHYYYLKADYTSLIEVGKTMPVEQIKDAWTLYRIGEAFNNKSDFQSAYEYLNKACGMIPYSLNFKYKMANAAAKIGSRDEAKNIYQFIIKENPQTAIALCNLGYLYMEENNIVQAEQLFDRALAIDPDYIQALFNKAGLLYYKKNKAGSADLLKKILIIEPENAEAKSLLKQINNH